MPSRFDQLKDAPDTTPQPEEPGFLEGVGNAIVEAGNAIVEAAASVVDSIMSIF